MKTVLFAVDGMIPDQKALAYTLTLCRRMLAKLDVLQIIESPADPLSRIKTLKSGVLRARDAFENTMVKATFAQAGVPDRETRLKAKAYDQFRRMLPKKPDSRIDYHCVVTGETTESVIERYVHGHRNVILTVFDSQPRLPTTHNRKKVNRLKGRRDMPKLAVPLVYVKNGR